MIQIKKSLTVPSILTNDGATHCTILNGIYTANPASCSLKKKNPLKINQKIYGDTTVKSQLIIDQHEKCCYCESFLLAVGYGDVEHFRPKGAYKQTVASLLTRPGYYWLAYSWENLFFSCTICNQKYKKNYFPLQNHSTNRSANHTIHIRSEQPYLIDLVKEDPEPHVTFKKSVAIALTIRGKKCLVAYGLNRLKLEERRRNHLSQLRRDLRLLELYDSISTIKQFEDFVNKYDSDDEAVEDIEEARKRWNAAALDTAEYAGMIRAAYPLLTRI